MEYKNSWLRLAPKALVLWRDRIGSFASRRRVSDSNSDQFIGMYKKLMTHTGVFLFEASLVLTRRINSNEHKFSLSPIFPAGEARTFLILYCVSQKIAHHKTHRHGIFLNPLPAVPIPMPEGVWSHGILSLIQDQDSCRECLGSREQCHLSMWIQITFPCNALREQERNASRHSLKIIRDHPTSPSTLVHDRLSRHKQNNARPF